ncbi:MAG: TIGR04282 family arsenosugar biosynthesis glycosyltransferase [Heliobacteriaceae bacterium]|nr:TIGR04282 family arsenosugar biosynthesis glycosyltransferase [Heliobacteriaceae bacterium]
MLTAVILMSRIPRPGFTKTRLMARLSGRECAEFHRRCLIDTCRAVRESGLAGYIFWAGAGQEPFEPGLLLKRCGLSKDDSRYFQFYPQVGKHLGERMAGAAEKVLSSFDAVLLLGTDLPEVTPGLLAEARCRLQEVDAVIGPAKDGGYYLIGIKEMHRCLFQDIPWGTAAVMEATRERLQAGALSYMLLETMNDIDTWDDLLDFYARGKTGSAGPGNLASYAYAAKLAARYRGKGG